MSTVQVGIGGLAVTAAAGDVLLTHALGSCVAVLVYCPASGRWGMAHVALPAATPGAAVRSEPGYYADRAVPNLLAALRHSVAGPAAGCEVVLVGGATVAGGLDRFAIGRRTAEACGEALLRAGMAARRSDLGGTSSRTVRVTAGRAGVQVSNPAWGVRTI